MAGWLARHAAGRQPVGVAVTGTFGRGTGSLTGVAVATADGPAGLVRPRRALDAADDAAVAAWLADPDRPKVLHDAKPALLAFAAHGWTLRGIATDTALAAYLAAPGPALLRPDRPRPALPAAASCGSRRPTATSRLDGLGPRVERGTNLMLRARATLDLADALTRGAAATTAPRGCCAEVEQPLVEVLAEMERTGIAADTEYLSELESHFAAEVKAAAQAAYQVVGREFNLGSPKQLQEILFNELGLPKTKRIKTG